MSVVFQLLLQVHHHRLLVDTVTLLLSPGLLGRLSQHFEVVSIDCLEGLHFGTSDLQLLFVCLSLLILLVEELLLFELQHQVVAQ